MTGGVAPAAAAITLRRMRWWDIAAVAALDRLLFAAGAWSAESFWSELAQPDSRRFLVAVGDDDAIVGFAGLMLNGPEAHVQTIGVAPAAQGRGLGRRLLTALIDLARDGGASALLLEVRVDNEAALRLYRSVGFEQIGLRRRYYQPGDVDALVMRLRPLPVPT